MDYRFSKCEVCSYGVVMMCVCCSLERLNMAFSSTEVKNSFRLFVLFQAISFTLMFSGMFYLFQVILCGLQVFQM